jgi:hypothetical protein
MEWKSDPDKLAWKMLAYIEKEAQDVTYSELESRAVTHGISLNLLDVALGKLHKFQKISQRVKGGDIVYCTATPKPKNPMTHLEWVKNNYPPMTLENDGSGIDADFSYMFLSPEEAEKFKCEQKGRAYIPRKPRNKKEALAPTPADRKSVV